MGEAPDRLPKIYRYENTRLIVVSKAGGQELSQNSESRSTGWYSILTIGQYFACSESIRCLPDGDFQAVVGGRKSLHFNHWREAAMLPNTDPYGC